VNGYELKAFVGKAIAAVVAKFGPSLARDPDEYRLVLFNIGWEGIGHWECECELSGLSLRGTPAVGIEGQSQVHRKPS
jgi:hypothetical protein